MSSALFYEEDDLTHLHLVAGVDTHLLDHAADRRGHFDRRLVGFELEDRLIALQRIAGLHHHAHDVA